MGRIGTPGRTVCHRCDRRACFNPDHLFIGTQADNIADAVAKGRMAKGERAGRAVLTEKAILDIRARVAAGAVQRKLAMEYGVPPATICDVVRRKTWKHL